MSIVNSVCVLICAVGAFQSVRDAVRLGAVHRVIIRDYSPTESIADLINDSKVIVRGVVTSVETRVIDDKDIVTDLSVQVLELYRSPAGGKPEPGRTIVVRQPGGTVVIDGKSITAADHKFPLLAAGNEYFLLLTTTPTGEYLAARGAQSVFRLSAGKVRQLQSAFSEWNGGAEMPVIQFIELLKSAK